MNVNYLYPCSFYFIHRKDKDSILEKHANICPLGTLIRKYLSGYCLQFLNSTSPLANTTGWMRSTHLLKLKRSLSKTSTGPVLLRIVRGWPASRQNTAPVSAVPRKLSNTPYRHGKKKKKKNIQTLHTAHVRLRKYTFKKRRHVQTFSITDTFFYRCFFLHLFLCLENFNIIILPTQLKSLFSLYTSHSDKADPSGQACLASVTSVFNKTNATIDTADKEGIEAVILRLALRKGRWGQGFPLLCWGNQGALVMVLLKEGGGHWKYSHDEATLAE